MSKSYSTGVRWYLLRNSYTACLHLNYIYTEMFYLMTHSTHFIYGYMMSDRQREREREREREGVQNYVLRDILKYMTCDFVVFILTL